MISPRIINDEGIISFVTTKVCGPSEGPYGSSNFGFWVGDTKEVVSGNFDKLCTKLGVDRGNVVVAKQVHGKSIWQGQAPGLVEGYDALICNIPGLMIGVTVADCVPILLYDSERRVCAAVHAGWKGVEVGILSDVIRKIFSDYGSDPKDLVCYLGPCISEKHFEVDEEVAVRFDSRYVQYSEQKGKYRVDLREVLKSKVLDLGIPALNIEVSTLCTVENNDLFYSYRKNGPVTGRMFAGMVMKKLKQKE